MPAAMLPWFSTAAAWDTSAVAGRFWGGVQFNTERLIVSVTNQSVKGGGSDSMHGNRSIHATSGRLTATPSGRMRSFSALVGSASNRTKGLQVAMAAHADMDATVLDVGTGEAYTEELEGVDVGTGGGAVGAASRFDDGGGGWDGFS